MRDQHIKTIRAACIKANPDKDCPMVHDSNYCAEHAIRLADVLLAMKPHTYFVDTQGGWWEWHQTGYDPAFFGKGTDWNLRKNDLTEQSDECITFLADLLK